MWQSLGYTSTDTQPENSRSPNPPEPCCLVPALYFSYTTWHNCCSNTLNRTDIRQQYSSRSQQKLMHIIKQRNSLIGWIWNDWLNDLIEHKLKGKCKYPHILEQISFNQRKLTSSGILCCVCACVLCACVYTCVSLCHNRYESRVLTCQQLRFLSETAPQFPRNGPVWHIVMTSHT